MKKKLCLLLLAVLVISFASVFAITAGAEAATNGMTFTKDTDMTVSGGITVQPNTVSATVSLSVEDLSDDSFRPGVIISNFKGSGYAYSFEIHNKGGRPRIYTRMGTEAVDITFKTTLLSVMNDNDIDNEPLRISIVVGDRSASVGSATLYIYDLEGKLLATETKSATKPYPTDDVYNPEYPEYMIGDCYASGDAYPFKGEIYEVAMYTGNRTAEQCKAVLDTADESMICGFDLTKEDPEYGRDLSGNGHHIKGTVSDEGGDQEADDGTWLSQNPNAPTDYAYSMVVVPDTQFLALNDVTNGTQYMNAIYKWIVDNKDEKNIQLVMGVGDITDQDTDAEWAHALEQVSQLNGKVPYTLTKGGSPHDRIATFNSYFGIDSYYGQNEIDGIFESGYTQNAYKLISMGGIDYLIMMLDFGPTDEVLEWAGEIIEEYSDRQVIITTHCYLYNETSSTARHQTETDPASPRSTTATGGALLKNNGDDIWNELVRLYPNIVMVLSGHYSNDYILTLQSKGNYGNTVTQMLVDSQDYDNANECKTGFVAVLYFSEDGKQVSVEYISTVRALEDKPAYFHAENQFSIDLDAEIAGPDNPYGLIPEEYDADTYPFVVFKEDASSDTGYSFYAACKSLYTETHNGIAVGSCAMHMARGDKGGTNTVILMRRNFACTGSDSYTNLTYLSGTMTLDLGGFVLTDNRELVGAGEGLFYWIPKTAAYPEGAPEKLLKIINGDIRLNNNPLLSYKQNSAVSNTLSTEFEKVDISFVEGATAKVMILNASDDKLKYTISINMNRCKIDLSNAAPEVSVLEDGFFRDQITFTTPSITVTGRRDKVTGISMTLQSNFIINFFVPANPIDGKSDRTIFIYVNGVEYKVEDLEYRTIDGVKYYVVKHQAAPHTLADELELKIKTRRLVIFQNNEKGSKDTVATVSVDTLGYLTKLSARDDEALSALAKDILSYVRAAYAYDDGDSAQTVIARIDGLIGENYDAGSAPVFGEAVKEVDGFNKAMMALGSAPAFILYPQLDDENQPIYDLSAYDFALDDTYRLNAEIREDEDGRQYFLISFYAYAFTGEVNYSINGTDISGGYNLSAYYYGFALESGDSKLITLVERLCKYAQSADAYRAAVIGGNS